MVNALLIAYHDGVKQGREDCRHILHRDNRPGRYSRSRFIRLIPPCLPILIALELSASFEVMHALLAAYPDGAFFMLLNIVLQLN